jgi:hypothetical protein
MNLGVLTLSMRVEGVTIVVHYQIEVLENFELATSA